MKNSILSILIAITLFGCEEVIEVTLPNEEPRLIIDALVRIDEDQLTTSIRVEVGLTSSFFTAIEPAQLSSVILDNPDLPTTASDYGAVSLTEVSPGVYVAIKSTEFFTNGNLQLTIEYEGNTYVANTRYVPGATIDRLEQGDGTLFAGNETEILISFTDTDNRNDYYLFDFDFGEYLVTEDTFYQGQTFQFSYFYDDGVTDGQEVSVSLLGVDEPFYNYMNQLIIQAMGDQGPFQTPMATVRGNFINTTDTAIDSDRYALGYFAVCQTFTKSIVID